MKDLGYYNGQIGPLDEMQVPMNNRACYFGDGVYDATFSQNHVPFALDEHIDRFYNSAALMRMDVPMGKAALRALLLELVKKVDAHEQFVYFQLSRGCAQRLHAFSGGPASLWVMLTPHAVNPRAFRFKLITVPDTRFFHCNAKTLNLLPNVLAKQRAVESGCDEAVFHRADRVTECSHNNVHIIKDGVLRTAPTDELILPGIARAHLLRACRALDIPVDETPFTVQELMAADEVIVTSSGTLCNTSSAIDGRPAGGRAPELIARLQDYLFGEFDRETR